MSRERADMRVPGTEESPASRWRSSQLAQTVTFVILDVIIIWTATIIAYFVRFEGNIPENFGQIIALTAITAAAVFTLLFLVFGLYGYIWRYVGVSALVRLGWVTLIGMFLLLVGDLVLTRPPYGRPIPFGVLLILGVMLFSGFFGVRIFGRLIAYVQSAAAGRDFQRALIVGAGDAGSLLLRDIESNRELDVRVAGFIDDDTAKLGRMLLGSRVLGTVDDIPRVVEQTGAQTVLVAMPSASAVEMRRVLTLCAEAHVPMRIIPALASGRGTLGVRDLEDVSLEDFLQREVVETDLAAVRSAIAGKRVMVTGAAGSIGAELCRQIARHDPAKLIMVDIDESRLYETYLEVHDLAPQAAWMSLCDIRNRGKLDSVFAAKRPQVVIHAAAYKHVPLMELEPSEAVATNILGTLQVLDMCTVYGVEDFTLISTDKAVMPTSVMGATKRVAERLAFAWARKGLPVTVVRFGNVLGSRGSVVPIFDNALRRGDTLRITHPEVTRYFMTIQEAVQLVLQARVLGDGADLFVLDMGDPVKVLDLAQALIEMRGGRADLEFSGLRPAEKLHEILVAAEEDLMATSCEKVLHANAVPLVDGAFVDRCREVYESSVLASPADVRRLLTRVVPEFSGDPVV